MKTVLAILVVLGVYASTPTISVAGNCDHSWQTAKDGSSCGNRAADRRDGGD